MAKVRLKVFKFKDEKDFEDDFNEFFDGRHGAKIVRMFFPCEEKTVENEGVKYCYVVFVEGIRKRGYKKFGFS